MEQPDVATDFGQVDRTSDPAFLVRFLDATRAKAKEFAEADPRLFFAFLEVREGHQVLDVGCGTGDLTRPLARLLGKTGRLVGVDSSATMVAEARQRSEGLNLPVEYRVGDAHHLDFASGTFDRCFANSLFQHLENPLKALAEMIRVARPDARIAVQEPDWGTHVIDASNRAVTRRILDFYCDSTRHGWIGRQLPALFKECGLADVVVEGQTTILEDFALVESYWLRTTAERAVQGGVVTATEVADWLDDLRKRGQAERFFTAVTIFRVSGRKP